MKKQTIIFVTFLNPFKQEVDGGAEEIKRRIFALAHSDFDIKIFALSKKANINNIAVTLPENIKLRVYQRKLSFRSLIFLNPFPVASRYNAELIEDLKKALASPVSALIFEGVQCKAIFDAISKTKPGSVTKIIRVHNIEQRYFTEMARASKRYFKKILYKICAFQYELIELDFYKHFDQIHFISNYELDCVSRKYNNPKKLFLFPPIANKQFIKTTQTIPTDKKKQFNLIGLGDMTLPVNIKSIQWFIDEIFTDLRDLHACSLHLAGKGSDRLKVTKGVVTYGYLPNLSEFISAGHIFIIPVLYGGGVKIKTIDALSMGIPLIGTSVAFEGIRADSYASHFVADTKLDFIDAVKKIQHDYPGYKKSAVAEGEKFVIEYAREKFVDHFNKTFQ